MAKTSRGANAGIGAGVGTVLLPGIGTVLGGALGSAFAGPVRPVQGRTFHELNPTGGGTTGIPTGDATFDPVSQWGKPRSPYGPDPGGPAYNPYGISRPGESIGKSAIYGGPRDLMKSMATRSLATSLTDQEFQKAIQGGPPTGLTDSLQSFAANRGGGAGGNLLGEAYRNSIAPQIDTTAMLHNLDYRNQLAQLMQNSYMQGGEILGSSKKAWASSKAIDKARRAQHTAQLQQIIGSFLPQEAGIRDIGQGATGLAGGG